MRVGPLVGAEDEVVDRVGPPEEPLPHTQLRPVGEGLPVDEMEPHEPPTLLSLLPFVPLVRLSPFTYSACTGRPVDEPGRRGSPSVSTPITQCVLFVSQETDSTLGTDFSKDGRTETLQW